MTDQLGRAQAAMKAQAQLKIWALATSMHF